MNNAQEYSWAGEMQRRLHSYDVKKESESWTSQCIYLLPEEFKGRAIQRYTPQMVSLGPYHHGRGHLQQAERHKERALIHMMRRYGGGGGGAQPNGVGRFWLSLSRIEKELRDHYDQNIELSSAEFLQMMLLDGCFMLEIMRAYRNMMQSTTDPGCYSTKDPIFSIAGMFYTVPIIRRDMLLIENQIPLLVLENLMLVDGESDQRKGGVSTPLLNLVVNFIEIPGRGQTNYPSAEGVRPRHVLDVFRKMQLTVSDPVVTNSGHQHGPPYELHPTATRLREAGVKFKDTGSHGLLGLRFETKPGFPGLFDRGVLRLPHMVVDDFTEETLRNLMAFERMHIGLGNEVSSYVHFMDRLIDSAKDVELLQEKGILQNLLGSDQEVAKLFNCLCRGVAVDGRSFTAEVQRKLVEYSRRRTNRWLANLRHNYLNSPWAVISLIGAFILLILTLLQTIHSAKSARSH